MANRFWVGGTATWDGTAGSKWATTTGGVGGAAVPTNADNVFFDASSTGNCTLSSTSVCRSLDCNGFTGTITHPAATTLNIGDGTPGAGNRALRLVAAMTYTLGNAATSGITFVSTSATVQTVTTGGKVLGNTQFNPTSGSAGTWQLADAFSATGATVTLTAGTLDTNNQTVTISIFSSSNANTRTLTMGSSSITCSSTGTPWTMATLTNLTITANTATINLTGGGATWAAGNNNYNGASVVITGAGVYTITQIPTVNNFTYIGGAVKTGTLSVVGMTCTGTFTFTGNSTINRVLMFSSVPGTQRTIICSNAPVLSNVDFADIVAAGAGGTWTGTSLGDALGNSNITFTTPVTRYGVGAGGQSWSSTGTWSVTSGGAAGASVPLPQDTVVINASSTANYTNDMPRLGASVDFTGYVGTFTFSTAGSIFGSLTLASGMTYSGSSTLTLGGRSTHTITSAGKTFGGGITISAPNGTYTMQDALACGVLQPLAGTLTTANFNLTIQRLTNTAAGFTLNGGTSTINITDTATVSVWTGTNGNLNVSTTTIVISTASSNARTFTGGSRTYGTLTYTVSNSPGSLTVTGANTFTNLSVASGRILTMPASTTTTIASGGNFDVNGAVNGYVYLPGVAANYISAPDSAALSITGDITIDVRVAFDDWTPPIANVFVSKSPNASTNYSYDFYLNTTGTLALRESLDGTVAALKVNTSSVATGLTDGAVKWLRASLDVDDGAGNRVCKFYMSDDGSTWTQLGTTQTTAGTTGAFDSPGALEIGSITTGATSLAFGKFYNAKIYNSYLQSSSGTPVFNADFTAKAFGANSFTESSSNAATVTINGVLAQAGDGRVSLTSSTPGTAAVLTKPTGTVSADYLTIQDSTAGVGWYAGANSVNVSNNKGWIFAVPPTNQGNFLIMM